MSGMLSVLFSVKFQGFILRSRLCLLKFSCPFVRPPALLRGRDMNDLMKSGRHTEVCRVLTDHEDGILDAEQVLAEVC